MQTGSGVSHEEVMGPQGCEFFQIWLQPDLQQAIAAPPTYQDFADAEFLMQSVDGVQGKQILGDTSPVRLQVPAAMVDCSVEAQGRYEYLLRPHRAIATLMVSGQGHWQLRSQTDPAGHGALVVVQNATNEELPVTYHSGHCPTRLVLIDVPLSLDYPLYPVS